MAEAVHTGRRRMSFAALSQALRKALWRTPFMVATAGSVLAVAVIWVLFPAIAPHDADLIDGSRSLIGPDSGHWLGTDQLGRDVFSRVIDGARTGLLGPLILAAATTAASTVIALVAGYLGGRVDAMTGRIIEVLYSVPPTIVAIVVVGVTGGGWWTAIVVLLVFGLPANVRLARAAVIVRARLPYVEAARTSGLSGVRIIGCHLLPAITPFVVAVFFLTFTYGIVDLSALSFLGLGVPPGAADWGRMIAENRSNLFQNAWATVAPAIALVLIAVSTNIIGDWIYSRYESHGRSR
ncbi:ABC transporter permease [Acrocarpospora pleiomorpha]|uniref:ABC transporter permease n=1 Tax=Acrocarpospora pleiomorpha TaxID=90975 RepID=A0A5M3X8X6_9ACTN|nr:ABC transporter permease [Acrocarpospora pleiomorpha]GES17172.1 ABC transporter permease [Acrocarpospora pleiomorpha]